MQMTIEQMNDIEDADDDRTGEVKVDRTVMYYIVFCLFRGGAVVKAMARRGVESFSLTPPGKLKFVCLMTL